MTRDTDEIGFGICVCGHEPVPPDDLRPAWAAHVGWGCAEWIEDGRRREHAPKRGEAAAVHLGFPFCGRVGDVVGFLFETPAAVWNGYADVPDALTGLRVVEARIVEARMRPPAAGDGRGSAIACVEVQQVVSLDDLLRSAPRNGAIHRNWAFYGTHVERAFFGDLNFVSFDAEGDLDAFAIWHDRDGVATLLVTGGSGHHENFFAAGNRHLAADELLLLAGGSR